MSYLSKISVHLIVELKCSFFRSAYHGSFNLNYIPMEIDQHVTQESDRIQALYSYDVLNSKKDEFLNNIVFLSSMVCEVPIAIISLVDDHRQYFKAKIGITQTETSRDISFCSHAIRQDGIFEIEDATTDPVFVDNPLVKGKLGIRFYAGVPLKDPAGYKIGTLCIIDRIPKKLNDFQKKFLVTMAQAAIDYIVLKKSQESLKSISNEFKNYFNLIPDLLCIATPEGYFKVINSAFEKELGYSEKELLKRPFLDLVHPEDIEKTVEILNGLNQRSEQIKFFRNRYQCKNGEYILLSWNAIQNPVTKMIFATARNVTEYEKMRNLIQEKKNIEEILNAKRINQLQRLSSEITDEFINPISLLIGFSDLALEIIKTEEKMSNDQLELYLSKIKEHSESMLGILRKMNNDVKWSNSPSVYHNL